MAMHCLARPTRWRNGHKRNNNNNNNNNN